jgi:phosphocarrier protein
MKTFEFTVADEVGIHARPAGLLVKAAQGFQSAITAERGGKSADMKKLFAVMGLGAKCGDTLAVTVSGKDEEEAAAALRTFMRNNL